jgi:hypothetical protein
LTRWWIVYPSFWALNEPMSWQRVSTRRSLRPAAALKVYYKGWDRSLVNSAGLTPLPFSMSPDISQQETSYPPGYLDESLSVPWSNRKTRNSIALEPGQFFSFCGQAHWCRNAFFNKTFVIIWIRFRYLAFFQVDEDSPGATLVLFTPLAKYVC